MRKLLHISLILAIMINAIDLTAQLPVNDAAWILQNGSGGTPDLSDDFSGTSIDTTKWSIRDETDEDFSPYHVPCYKSNITVAYNSTIGSVTARLKADSVNHVINGHNYKYSGSDMGMIWWSYKYGYLEIRAKYPEGYESYWPAFWIWGQTCNTPKWYNEVDICENRGGDIPTGQFMGTNVHTGTISPTSCALDINLPGYVTNLPHLNLAFHKYAIKWDTNNVSWYFDDSLVRSIYDADGDSLPQHTIATILNFNVDTTYANHHTASASGIPATFEIDYFHYYKLSGDCGTDLTNLCTLAGYDRKVKKTITTGTSCSPDIDFSPNTSAGSYTFRATNYILLDAPTSGHSLTINPTGAGSITIETVLCPK